ncbi:MAG: MptD family putative ECF transporter S component [Candidatus Helarchaeota archaeon]
MNWNLESRDLGFIGITCGLLIVVGFITIMPVVAFDFLGIRAITFALPKGIIIAVCVSRIKKSGVISMIGIIMGLIYLILPGSVVLSMGVMIAGVSTDALIYVFRLNYKNNKTVIAGVALYDFISTILLYVVMVALGLVEMFKGMVNPRNLFEMLVININNLIGNPQMPFIYLLGITITLASCFLNIVGAWLGIKISAELKQAGAID